VLICTFIIGEKKFLEGVTNGCEYIYVGNIFAAQKFFQL
jgi:hypothetical protein